MSEEIKDVRIYPEPGGRYEHYKGGHYVVLGVGRHTETEEILVAYRSVEFGTLHMRPIQVWNEPTADGKERFKLLGMTRQPGN